MFKTIIGTSTIKVTSLFIVFLVGVIISRTFGTSGKGLVTMLVLIPTMTSIYLSLSLEEGFLYYIGKNKINRSTFDELIIRISILFFPIFSAVFTFIYFFVEIDPHPFIYGYNYIPQFLFMCAILFRSIFQSSLRAMLKFYLFNLFEIIKVILLMVGIIMLVFLDKTPIEIIWVYLVAEASTLFFQYIYIRKNLPLGSKATSLLKIIKYSYKVHFFKILNLSEGKFDLLIVGYFLSLSDVGIYSIVLSFSLIFQTVIQSSISTVLLPNLVKLENNEENLRVNLTIRYYRISLCLALLFFIIMYLVGSFLIVNIYGDEFKSAYFPLIILLIGSLIKFPSPCINAFFKSIGIPEELYKTSVISLTFNIFLCLILIPIYGIVGAAISSSVSYFIYGGIMLYKFKNKNNLKIIDIFRGLQNC